MTNFITQTLPVYIHENVLSKNKSLNKLCYLPKQQIKARFEARLTVYPSEIVSVCQSCVKQGSEAMGSAAMMKHTPQLSCQMLKMGSSGHSGSTQGVYAWKVVEADD